MARRETPIVIQPLSEPLRWEEFPPAVQDIFQRGFERKLERLRARGVQVWLPVGEGLRGGNDWPGPASP